MHLIDTNVAIYLRDLNSEIVERVATLPMLPQLSLISWVELEGGVTTNPVNAASRRTNVDRLLAALSIVPVEPSTVLQYREIVRILGFSRPRILDRLIAATAIVHDLTLITINGADFRDIPGLRLEIWPAPAQ